MTATSVILSALLAVKELEITTPKERVKWLEDVNSELNHENEQLYLLTGQQTELLNKSQPIGYHTEGRK